MHDPLCLAAAFRPDFIHWQPSYVDVELAGTLTLGETVAYFGRPDSPPSNVLAPVGVDAERFIMFYLERIENAFHA
jgi:inosine-uridine nucleoside N-ribohydrolase